MRLRNLSKARAARKQKVYKVKRRSNMSMAKRRVKSRRRSSSRGFGGILGMVEKAGLAFAVGNGTAQVLNATAQIVGLPQLQQVAPLAGAFTAYKTGKGIPGIVAAYPLLTQGGLNILGGLTGNQTQQAQGIGAFT